MFQYRGVRPTREQAVLRSICDAPAHTALLVLPDGMHPGVQRERDLRSDGSEYATELGDHTGGSRWGCPATEYR